eukprot:365144-Chlamydomonas_euryale.AAC.4
MERSVLPGLAVQGTFRRHCSNPWPTDQLSAARQLERVPESGAITRAFFMAPPECTAVHHRTFFHVLVTLSSIVPCDHLPQLTLLMSNPKPAAASNLRPFSTRAPSSEGSILKTCPIH